MRSKPFVCLQECTEKASRVARRVLGKELGISSSANEERERSGYRAGFMSWVNRAETALISNVKEATGIDISDHRPENLQVIDRSLGPHFRDVAKRTKPAYERSSIGIGCYLGEVVIRNLGGRWHYPNYLQTLLVLALGNPFRSEKYIYVRLGERKVYPLSAARTAIDKTSKEFSLYELYQQWARDAKSPKLAHQ